jgi:hypothetical protein
MRPRPLHVQWRLTYRWRGYAVGGYLTGCNQIPDNASKLLFGGRGCQSESAGATAARSARARNRQEAV